MCLKKPKLPEKTQEDLQLEAEMQASRAATRRELAASIRSEKDAQAEATYARLLGFIGNRSLIRGPKGGAGFMGAGSGKIMMPAPASGSSGGGTTTGAPAAIAPAPTGRVASIDALEASRSLITQQSGGRRTAPLR